MVVRWRACIQLAAIRKVGSCLVNITLCLSQSDMASAGSRRWPHRTLERQNTKSDDPWCLVCGVNLALDGRTFTVLVGGSQTELVDVCQRVLAVHFTDDSVMINVCNRCERQLKRLGRTPSLAVARHEGQKFRDQVEKNLSKRAVPGVELGDFRDLHTVLAPQVSRKVKESSSPTTSSLRQSGDVNPRARKAREDYTRSSSIVRFEDEGETKARGAYHRDRSAPERATDRRGLQSSVNESDSSKETKRGARPLAASVPLERSQSLRARSSDRKLTEVKAQSQQKSASFRDKTRNFQKMNSVDTPPKPAARQNITTTSVAREIKKKDNNTKTSNAKEPHNESSERKSGRFDGDKETIFRPISSPIVTSDFESSGNFEDDDMSRRPENRATNNNPFTGVDSDRFRGSSLSSDSSCETESSYDNRARQNVHSHQGSEGVNGIVYDETEKEKRLKVTFSDEEAQNPRPGADTNDLPSELLSVKGKISKYESLDLDIDNKNPFFDEVQCEYNRRVAMKGKGRRIVGSHPAKTGTWAPPTIEEADMSDASQITGSDSISSPDESVRANSSVDTNDVIISRTVEEDFNSLTSPVGFFVNSGDPTNTRETEQSHLAGGQQSENTPLITEPEAESENKGVDRQDEDHDKEVSVLEEVVPDHHDKTPDQAEDEGKEPGLQAGDDVKGKLSDTEAEVESELVVSQTFMTHLELSLDRAEDREDSPGHSGDGVANRGSQVELQPLQTDGTLVTKNEASPLIDKEAEPVDKAKVKDSKFKDQQPGALCCTIL